MCSTCAGTSVCFRPGDCGVTCDARVWREVRQGDFFHWLRMNDVSEEFNEIYLELPSEHLFRTMRSTGNASALKPQLTNKRPPYLDVAVELPLLTGWIHNPVVVHNQLIACEGASQNDVGRFPRAQCASP